MIDYTQEELDALKKEHAANATDEQFKLWIAECRTRNLAPVRDIIMQIRTSEEYDPEIKAKVKKKKSIYIVTIGAKRKIANATGLYAGQLPTKWIYLDGANQPTIESEIPLPDPENPQLPLEPWACRTTILRKGFDAPLTVVSRFGAYCQTFKRGETVQLTAMWSANGRSCEMLEKCGESSCLTRAFPSELSGLYINEELQKDDVLESIPVAAEVLVEAPKAAIVPTVNHAPAVPTNEPRPGEKVREVASKVVEILTKPEVHEQLAATGQQVNAKAVGQLVESAVASAKPKKNVKEVKIEEVILDKVEVVSGGDPQIDKPAPVVDTEIAEPVQKMDNSKPFSERCRDLIKAGVNKDNLRAYVLQAAGTPDAADTRGVKPEQWNAVLPVLEALLSESGKEAVNTLVAAKPEPEVEAEEPF